MRQESVGYRITHKTRYQYSNPVAVCRNQLRMQPNSQSSIVCHSTNVEVTPTPTTVREHQDYYGNRVYMFSIESLHRELLISVLSDVSVSPKICDPGDDIAWEILAERLRVSQSVEPSVDEHRFDSPRITRSELFAEYALRSFTTGRGVLDAASDLTSRIHQDFKFDSAATNVCTSTEQAFALKAGVCQDFAHIQIGCLRSIGIPARYVSGYLRTNPPPGKPRLIGADQSHAWLSLYCGDGLGWVDCDPTNACIVGSDHIPICVGRDYDDVSPVRGVVLGGGKTSLEVSVDVEPTVIETSK